MSAALETEIVIAGGGIAGITTALELLDQGRRVTLLERAPRERLGGLANEAFGGMLFGGTGLQRLNGIHDSPELFRDDWYRAAEFGPDDHWPMRWADTYIERCVPDVHDWVRGYGIHYFPVVHWVERGDHRALNSLPRYHVLWGTGLHLTQTLIRALESHPNRDKLDLRCGHYVEDFLTDQGRLSGVRGRAGDVPFTLKAGATVVASGGINGNLQRVRQVWDRERYGPPPALLLNGAHPDGDGALGIHDLAGNVAEWVEPRSEAARGQTAGKGVLRGGSWRSTLAADLRIWSRAEVSAGFHDATTGARCAYEADGAR